MSQNRGRYSGHGRSGAPRERNLSGLSAKIDTLTVTVKSLETKLDGVATDVKSNTALLNKYQGGLGLIAGAAVVVGLVLSILNYSDNHARSQREAQQQQQQQQQSQSQPLAPQKCPK